MLCFILVFLIYSFIVIKNVNKGVYIPILDLIKKMGYIIDGDLGVNVKSNMTGNKFF